MLFLTAGGVATLLAARLAQGIATGAAITTLSAAVVDLTAPSRAGRAGLVTSVATLLGLAAGSVGTGALVEFAPAPTQLVYVVLLVGVVAAAVATALLPETAPRRPGALASLRPRVGMPAYLRSEFLSITPILLASWALGGLYLSLGPSVAASSLGITDHLVGGLVATLLCGTGALTALALRNWPLPRVLLAGRGPARGGHAWAPSPPSTRARRRSPRSARSSRASASARRASARSAPWPRWRARPSAARCSRSPTWCPTSRSACPPWWPGSPRTWSASARRRRCTAVSSPRSACWPSPPGCGCAEAPGLRATPA